MQVGGIGSGNGSGNSGLDDRGVSRRKEERRIDHPVRDEHTYGTAGTGVEEKTTSAYAVSISSEGKRLAAERLGANSERTNEDGSDGRENGQSSVQSTGESESWLERLKSLLQSGKELLKQIWSGGAEEHHETQIAAGSINVQAPAGMTSADPYFNNTSDAGKVKEPLLERIRIRFRDIAGQLSNRFGGMLSGQFSAESRMKDQEREQEQTGETQAVQAQEIRQRKRHYVEAGVVVDISSTDEGHLMDSYDKNGKYSKLTTEKKG